MINYLIKNNQYNNLIILIFFVILILSGLGFSGWNYDEYGAVVSHLELNDPRFIDQYIIILKEIGFNDFFIDKIIIPLVQIFIVPIRWTYAIGISPIYSIIRIEDLPWDLVKTILIIAHASVSCLGLKLISHAINDKIIKLKFLTLFSAIILLSNPFVYWLNSFTSYSYHIFCFGILILVEFKKYSWEKKFIGKLSFSRAIIPIFNYQYIPVLFALGLIELLRNRKKFFLEKFYKSWILSIFVSIIAAVFILIRLSLINTDIDPELNFPNATDYLIQYGGVESILSILKFITSRFVDIFYYFFFTVGFNEYFRLESFSNLDTLFSFIILLLILIFFIMILRLQRLNKDYFNIIKISMLIIFVQAFLYIFNILPISPSRHSLILFLPLSSLLVISFIYFWDKIFFKNSIYSIFTVLMVVAIFYFHRIDQPQPRVISTISKECVIDEQVSNIILEPCYFEPVLDNKDYKFIYSCGTFNNESVNKSTEKIAIFSLSNLTYKQKKNLILRYSNSNWIKDMNAEKNVDECVTKHNLEEDTLHVKIDIFKKSNFYESN